MSQSLQVVLVTAGGLTFCFAALAWIVVQQIRESFGVIAAAPAPVVADRDLWAADLDWTE